MQRRPSLKTTCVVYFRGLSRELKDIPSEILKETERRELNIVGFYYDPPKSAEPLGLKTLLADLPNTRPNSVVISELSELNLMAGNVLELLNFLREIQQRGCEVVAVRDQLDTSSPTQDFLKAFSPAWARFEKTLRGTRLRKSFLRAREQGVHIGRPRTRDDKKILELRGKGWSLNKISKELGVSRWTVRAAISGDLKADTAH